MDDVLDQLAASTVDRDDGLHAYADALILRGEPLGELINVALARAVRDKPELARREAALIAIVQAEVHARIQRLHPSGYRWRLGFLDAVRIELPLADPLEPIATLANEPSARLLRRLEIIVTHGGRVLAPQLEELASLAHRLPRLVELVITERAPPADDFYFNAVVDIDARPLVRAYPALEVLQLSGAAIDLGELALPALRVLRVLPVTLANIRSVVAAQVPKLEHLGLQLVLPSENVDAIVGPLLYRDFPALRSLEISDVRNELWLATTLPQSPLVRRLERLRMRGLQQPATYDALVANAQLLANLTLELDEESSRIAFPRISAAYRGRIRFF